MISENGIFLRDTIKKLMKNKSYSYQDMAEYLNLTESAVKKFMSQSDLNFERLVQIAEWLDLTIYDLIEASKNISLEEVYFNKAQEDFFLSHPEHLTVFFKILDGVNAERIADEYKLTDKSLDYYLSNLERLGLIVYKPNARVKPVKSGYYIWRRGTDLEIMMSKKIKDANFEVLSSLPLVVDDIPTFISGFSLMLRPETYNELYAELAVLIDKYASKSEVQKKKYDRESELVPISSLLLMGKTKGTIYKAFGFPVNV